MKKLMEKLNKILIPIAIIVAGLIIGGAFLYTNQGRVKTPTNESSSAQEIVTKAVDYINKNVLSGVTASLTGDVTEENGMYKFRIKVNDQEYVSYVTKNGKLLFPMEGLDLESNPNQAQNQNQGTTTGEVQKSDKPDVKLFVMSYCPYGLQAEKMFLPVYNLLKDKADMGVYFVDYAMHGKKEIDENLTQYCIQKEEKAKYYAYLNCFVIDGDSAKCLSQAGVDKGKIDSCVSATDTEFEVTSLYNDKSTWLSGNYPQFNVHKDLNTKYGVQGSPTIVINDKVVEVDRTPEKFKEAICQAFNSPPEECSQTLSSESPSAGLGGGTTDSSSSGGCGQ